MGKSEICECGEDFSKWCDACEEAARNRPSALSDGLGGSFITAWECTHCKEELSWYEKMQSKGTCPYCGACSGDTVVDVKAFAKKWVETKTYKWWEKLFMRKCDEGYWVRD